MWKKFPEDSGYYWYFFSINNSINKTIVYYEKNSKLVSFTGDTQGTPLEHLNEFNGSWLGPLTPPELT